MLSLVISLLLLGVLAQADQTRQNDLVLLYPDQLPVVATRLTVSCFRNLPARYRDRCRKKAFDKYSMTLYSDKRQCCSRWVQIRCLREYLFNSIYCNTHEQQAVRRFLAEIDRVALAPKGACAHYPPIEMELPFVDEELGQLPKCVPRGIV